MSDGSALRFVIDSAWKALNLSVEWNGFTFTYGQVLVFFLAVAICGLILHFFA